MDMDLKYYNCFGDGVTFLDLVVIAFLLEAALGLIYAIVRKFRPPHPPTRLRLGRARHDGGASIS